jgi:hypothetical protein
MPLIDLDLDFFGRSAIADVPDAIAEAVNLAEAVRVRALECPPGLLGHLYVLEGSTLGGAVLREQVSATYGLTGAEGTRYLSAYGANLRPHWGAFCARMDAVELGEGGAEAVLRGAEDTYAAFARILRALYPLDPKTMRHDVASINPEAGRHAVPSDPREIDAAFRAGDRCWRQFPYYESRYGTRGRRFADSDGAWLVTLCGHTQDQMHGQVDWLHRVLAARGMPGLLLQEHLEVLHEELSRAVAERREDYAKLLVAAERLRRLRRRHMEDARIHELSEWFDQQVGAEWAARLPRTGELVAAAVADEREGIAGAVESVEGWLADGSRFPPEWVSAVRKAFAKARGG